MELEGELREYQIKEQDYDAAQNQLNNIKKELNDHSLRKSQQNNLQDCEIQIL